jgi:hypothetical protein
MVFARRGQAGCAIWAVAGGRIEGRPDAMSASEFLFLAVIVWIVPPLPVAVAFGRLDRWTSAPLAIALGPFAYLGLELCRRHRDEAARTSLARHLRV